MNNISANRFTTSSDPGAETAVSDSSMLNVVCRAKLCDYSALTSMNGGSKWVRDLTLTDKGQQPGESAQTVALGAVFFASPLSRD
jgi:hypothetical protein